MSQMKSQTASAAMKPDKLSDDALKSAVIAEIKKNTAVDVSTIQVEAKDGTVTLSGTAKSSTEKYAAGRSAMAVKGATIKNEIVVGPAAATRSP
jgi:osmotically-inducible protein OsmY